MIYVSTAGVRGETIKERIEKLVEVGILSIELSGGSKYYPEVISDVLQLQKKYSLQLLLHNYFPPPEQDFVFNLASQNSGILEQSIEHAKAALDLAHTLACPKIGFHAGFLFDIPVSEIGSSIQQQDLFDKQIAWKTFSSSLAELKNYSKNPEIYIENNVLSTQNFQNFGKNNPFFLVSGYEIEAFKKELNCNFLLDVAHFKVSCTTLDLDFQTQLQKLLSLTDYIHLSETKTNSDTNDNLMFESGIWQDLRHSFADLRTKDITLEISASPTELQATISRITKELYDN